jgi:hypothetical protein
VKQDSKPKPDDGSTSVEPSLTFPFLNFVCSISEFLYQRLFIPLCLNLPLLTHFRVVLYPILSCNIKGIFNLVLMLKASPVKFIFVNDQLSNAESKDKRKESKP